MDRIVYTAMAGAKQSFNRQSTISNNLANVSTTGFRAALNASRSVPVQGDGRLATRTSVVETTPGASFQPGPVNHTGRKLDVALKGDAWLAVMDDRGVEAYTRRGDLQIGGDGMMTTGDGRPVMGDGGPIVVPPGSEVFIGDDGTLSLIGMGDSASEISRIGALKLVDGSQESLVRGGDGLFRPEASLQGVDVTLDAGEGLGVSAGSLEGSNVNPVESMVAMIDVQRMYEMQMSVLDSADENAKSANSLLSLR
jgi:flagellar basal-body rod protein FlgF